MMSNSIDRNEITENETCPTPSRGQLLIDRLVLW